jgi:ferric-dicitrate binding protein FerR (iron transport regulator)
MFRRAMAVTMSLLLSLPLWAISSPVGTIALGSKVMVGGVAAATGSSLYSGDTLAVQPDGKASILLSGGARANMAPNSEARVVRDGSALALELMRGGMAFTSSAKSMVIGRVADVTFRPENPAQGAVGYVIFKDPTHPVFYADKGDWLLSTAHDGHNMVLHRGEKIEGMVTAQQDQNQGETPEQAQKKKHRKKMAVIWIGTALVGTVTGLALAYGMSECTTGSGPGCQVASPVVPQ